MIGEIMSDPFDRPARPWDLFNKSLGRVETVVAAQRMAICNDCPMLSLGVCQECHCVMALKTKLPNAACPLHKWGQVRVLDDVPQRVVIVVDGIIQDVLDADDRLASLLLSNPTLIGVPLGTDVKVGERHGDTLNN
jgi:hypothetical protein